MSELYDEFLKSAKRDLEKLLRKICEAFKQAKNCTEEKWAEVVELELLPAFHKLHSLADGGECYHDMTDFPVLSKTHVFIARMLRELIPKQNEICGEDIAEEALLWGSKLFALKKMGQSVAKPSCIAVTELVEYKPFNDQLGDKIKNILLSTVDAYLNLEHKRLETDREAQKTHAQEMIGQMTALYALRYVGQFGIDWNKFPFEGMTTYKITMYLRSLVDHHCAPRTADLAVCWAKKFFCLTKRGFSVDAVLALQ